MTNSPTNSPPRATSRSKPPLPQSTSSSTSSTSSATNESIRVIVRIRPETEHSHLSQKDNKRLAFNDFNDSPSAAALAGSGGKSCLTSHLGSPSTHLSITGTPNTTSSTTVASSSSSTTTTHNFTFDKIYSTNSTQSDLFNTNVSQLVIDAVNGFHTTIFAYGCTGSGKSYCIMGEDDNFQNPYKSSLDNTTDGIIPRAINLIFSTISKENATAMVFVSYVELYNNQFYDLLSDQSKARRKIEIRESSSSTSSTSIASSASTSITSSPSSIQGRGIYLSGISRIQVTSPSAVHTLVTSGTKLRATSATKLNERSSRSHAILTLEIESIKDETFTSSLTSSPPDQDNKVKMGKLNIVDLAGSERVGLSGVEGDQLVEASAINGSLAALGDVLNALSKFHRGNNKGGLSKSKEKSQSKSGQRQMVVQVPYIPFRNSKLTHLLKDSLGGSCKTLMIATIRPGTLFYNQTLSTLRYASRARDIENTPRVHGNIYNTTTNNNRNSPNNNTTSDDSSKLASAYYEITKLRTQLSSRAREFERLKLTSNPKSPDSLLKFDNMKTIHEHEVKELQRHLGGLVRTVGGELDDAKLGYMRLSEEFEMYKSVGERERMEAIERISHANLETEVLTSELVDERERARNELISERERGRVREEEAKFKLDDDARKTLKKLAVERKSLKEKNEDLEGQVLSMKKQVEELQVKVKTAIHHNPKKEDNNTFVKDLQSELQTLRTGLANAISFEDAAAEAKTWKNRCVEAVSHLERLKRDLLKSDNNNNILKLKFSNVESELVISKSDAERNEQLVAYKIDNFEKQAKIVEGQLSSYKSKRKHAEEQAVGREVKIKELELLVERCNVELSGAKDKVKEGGERLDRKAMTWEAEKVKFIEDRKERLVESEAIANQNELLKDGVARLNKEITDETKKHEHNEREASKLNPLKAKLVSLTTENIRLQKELEAVREKARKNYESDSRNSIAVKGERDVLKVERDKLNGVVVSLKSEVHELNQRNVTLVKGNGTIANNLKVECNVTIELKEACELMKTIDVEKDTRLALLTKTLHSNQTELTSLKQGSDKINEDNEALSALCNSLQQSKDRLEQKNDYEVNELASKVKEYEGENKMLVLRISAVEKKFGNIIVAFERVEGENGEVKEMLSAERDRSNTLTSELSKSNENSARLESQLSAMNEKLNNTTQSSARLLKEKEHDEQKYNRLNFELAKKRSERDGEFASRTALVAAAAKERDKEKLAKDAALVREKKLSERLSILQAEMTEEVGGRRAIEVARDAAIADAGNLRRKAHDNEDYYSGIKSERDSQSLAIEQLKESDYKTKGKALALTLEIEDVRKRLEGERDKLVYDYDDLKERFGEIEDERNIVSVDRDDVKTTLALKSKEVKEQSVKIKNYDAELKAEKTRTTELVREIAKLKEKVEAKFKKFKASISSAEAATTDARNEGYETGFKKGKKQVKEELYDPYVKKVLEHFSEMKESEAEKDKNSDVANKELREAHRELEAERAERVKLKVLLYDNEAIGRDLLYDKEKLEDDIAVISNKSEYFKRQKDDIMSSMTVEIDDLRRRNQAMEKDLDCVVKEKEALKVKAGWAKKVNRDLKEAIFVVKNHVIGVNDLEKSYIFDLDGVLNLGDGDDDGADDGDDEEEDLNLSTAASTPKKSRDYSDYESDRSRSSRINSPPDISLFPSPIPSSKKAALASGEGKNRILYSSGDSPSSSPDNAVGREGNGGAKWRFGFGGVDLGFGESGDDDDDDVVDPPTP